MGGKLLPSSSRLLQAGPHQITVGNLFFFGAIQATRARAQAQAAHKLPTGRRVIWDDYRGPGLIFWITKSENPKQYSRAQQQDQGGNKSEQKRGKQEKWRINVQQEMLEELGRKNVAAAAR